MNHFVIKRHDADKSVVYAGTTYNGTVFVPLYSELDVDEQFKIMLFASTRTATDVLHDLQKFEPTHSFAIYHIQDLYGGV
jgi:hypothetical protein